MIRSIVFCNLGAAPALTDIAVVPRTRVSAYYLYWNGAAPASSTVVLDVRAALEQGDLVQLESAATNWSCTITGYVFQS